MISIIIPSLNEEKYIEETLKSMKNQDFEGEYEIILVDGGSKDKTIKIAKKYTNNIIKIGRGISKARNRGAKESKGNILIFVDADTRLLYNTVSVIEKTFKKKEVVAATCPTVPGPAVKDFIPYWAFNVLMEKSIKSKKAKIPGWCFACRKSVFESLGGFDESLSTGEDFDLSSKLSKKGKIVFMKETFSITSPRRIRNWGLLNGTRKYIETYIMNHIVKKNIDMEKYGIIR